MRVSEVARSAAKQAAAGVWGRNPQRGSGAELLAGARRWGPWKILMKYGP